jgi:hypothetical protein
MWDECKGRARKLQIIQQKKLPQATTSDTEFVGDFSFLYAF